MSAFKVGDVVIAQNLAELPERNGFEGTIYDIRENHPVRGSITGRERTLSVAYRVEWSDGRRTAQEAHQLRLKRPPSNYDGNQAGEWDLCPWQPKRERA